MRFPQVALLAVASMLAVTTPASADVLRFITAYGVPGDHVGAYGLTLSPDGRSLYVSTEFDDAIELFARDPGSGRLTPVEATRTVPVTSGENITFGPRGIALSPDGRHLYVAGHNDDTLDIFGRDAITGTLTFLGHKADTPGSENGLAGAEAVLVSPDGTNVYVAGRGGFGIAESGDWTSLGSVVVFQRDAATGLLTFVETDKEGVGSVTGIAGARGLVLSPDGAHLYVAGGGEDAVAVFRRDATTGALAFMSVVQNGVGGVDGLAKVQAIAITPDGKTLVATGTDEDKLAVFGRDPQSGTLTEMQVLEDGFNDIDGLNDPQGVAISPDGATVYVSSGVDDALAVFHRDAQSGLLEFVEAHRDDQPGIAGLRDARGVVATGDGLDVYVASHAADAVASFRRAGCGDGVVDPGEACDDGNVVDGDCCAADCRSAEPVTTACPDDGNTCTDDHCNGTGACVHVANTAPCDDGFFCTVNDTCQGGGCHGTLRDCSSFGSACADGVCVEAIDACIAKPKADGAACEDGNACTHGDTCVAGICTAGRPLQCPAPACYEAGACDPRTGCSFTPSPDGSPCDDGNAGTAGDVCAAGVCRGAPLVLDCAGARCAPGGGPASTDCLLEFRPTVDGTRAHTRGAPVLRCTDGDPACDLDGRKDGRCTVGVALCLGVDDPRLGRCRPGNVVRFEMTSPSADRARSTVDRANAVSVERTVAAMGVEVRRGPRTVVAPGTSPDGHAGCGDVAKLIVPASPSRHGKPGRRVFRTVASTADGRVDVDRLAVECRANGR